MQWISGIEPDNKFYSTGNILHAIQQATGYSPGIECTRDSVGNNQLYQVYMCAGYTHNFNDYFSIFD